MTMNTFSVELHCPHCHVLTPAEEALLITSVGDEDRGFRLGDPVPTDGDALEARFLPTAFPGGSDTTLLMAWTCRRCGQGSHVSLVVRGGHLHSARAEVLSAAQFSRATHVEEAVAEQLFFLAAGSTPYLAGAQLPGWATAVKNTLEGRPPFSIGAQLDEAVDEVLEKLRLISWTGRDEPQFVEPQLEGVRRHYDAVHAWLRLLEKRERWPHLSFWTVVPDDLLWSYAESRLRAESWWNALSDERPAKVECIELIGWTCLDVQGRIPFGVPDVYGPLLEAWQVNGAPFRSRKLRNELEFGVVTLRLGTFEEWCPNQPRIKTVTRWRP